MQLQEVQEPARKVPNASGSSVFVNECGDTVILHFEIEEHIEEQISSRTLPVEFEEHNEEQSASGVAPNVCVSLAVAEVSVHHGDQLAISNVGDCAPADCASVDGSRPCSNEPTVSCCASARDSEDSSSNGHALSLSPTAVDVAAALAADECRSSSKEERLCSPGLEVGVIEPTLPSFPSPGSTTCDIVDHIPCGSRKTVDLERAGMPGPSVFKISVSTASSPSPPAAAVGPDVMAVAASVAPAESSSLTVVPVSTPEATIESVRQVAPLLAERASRLLAESNRKGVVCATRAAAGALLMAAAAAAANDASDTSQVKRQTNASLLASSYRPSFQQRAALTDIPSCASPRAVVRAVAPCQGAITLLAANLQSSSSSCGGAMKMIESTSTVACEARPPNVSSAARPALKGRSADEEANSDEAEAGRKAGVTVASDECAAVAETSGAACARERCIPSTVNAAAETPNAPAAMPAAAKLKADAALMLNSTDGTVPSTVFRGSAFVSLGGANWYAVRPVLLVPATAFRTVPNAARQPAATTSLGEFLDSERRHLVATASLRDSAGSERQSHAAICSHLSRAVSPQHKDIGFGSGNVNGPAARPEPPLEVESCSSQCALEHPDSTLEAGSRSSRLQQSVRPVPPVRTAAGDIDQGPALPKPPRPPPATDSLQGGLLALNGASSSNRVLSTQGAVSRKRKLLPAPTPPNQGPTEGKCACCGLRFCPRLPSKDFNKKA